MFALLVLVTSIILIAALALTVIGVLALNRRSKEQWKNQVRATSQMVWDGTSFEKTAGPAPAKKVSFGELWEAESEVGNAYWELPPYLAEFSEQRQVLLEKVRTRGAESDGADALGTSRRETSEQGDPENEGEPQGNSEPPSSRGTAFLSSLRTASWKVAGQAQSEARPEHPVG